MIQKTKSQIKTPPSTGDKKAPPRVATLPSPFEERERRKRLYGDSRVFSNELAVVTGDLLHIASSKYRDDIFEFLKWFHPDRHRSQAIATRIRVCPNPIHSALEHYVAFAFRFRVWLRGKQTKDGRLRIWPVFEGISGPHLDAKLRKGALVPPGRDVDNFVESNEAGDHYEDCRFKLLSQAVSDETEPFRLLRFEVAENRTSELMHILNTFYDPLAMNFVEIRRRISRNRIQNYLMCLIGELSDEKAWRKAGSVRTQMIKRVYGVSTRGRKPNLNRCARDMILVAEHGANIKASTQASIEQRGENPAKLSDKDYRRDKQRMIRATKTYDKLTSRQS